MWQADDGAKFESKTACEKHEKVRRMASDFRAEYGTLNSATAWEIFTWVLDRYDVQFPPGS